MKFSILSLIALAIGVVLAIASRGNIEQQAIGTSDFVVQCQRASNVPILYPVGSRDLAEIMKSKEFVVPAASHVFVVDEYVTSIHTFTPIPLLEAPSSADRPGGTDSAPYETENVGFSAWFSGRVKCVSEIATDSAPRVSIGLTGAVYANKRGGGIEVLRTPVHMSIDMSRAPHLSTLRAPRYVTVAGMISKLYINLLLMLFVPTLALSLLSALVNSAHVGPDLRIAMVKFILTTIVGSALGVLCVRVLGVWITPTYAPLPAPAEYDPHPMASAIERLIPTNPFGMLTSTDANSGLQVVVVVLLLGGALATVGPDRRRRIGALLRSCLSVITGSDKPARRAVMDYVAWVTPLGVFAMSYTAAVTLDAAAVKPLGNLFAAILLGLALHSIALTVWMQVKLGGRWWSEGLRPAGRGLLTAFVTASSYAAYPSMVGVPLLAAHSKRRAVFDLGTALNKNGTAVYIAASAAALAIGGSDPWVSTLLLIVVSGLGASAAAGLPFAAILGLRMALAAIHENPSVAWTIIALDPIVDRFVTTTNVFANLACAGDVERDPHVATRSPNATDYLRDFTVSTSDIAAYWRGLDGTLIRPHPANIEYIGAQIDALRAERKKALDICILGCTPEVRRRIEAEGDRVDVVDLSRQMWEAMTVVAADDGKSPRTERFIRCDWIELVQLESRQYDVVVGIDVFNMIPQDEWDHLASGAATLLKDDGLMITQTVTIEGPYWAQSTLTSDIEGLSLRYKQLSSEVDARTISVPEMLAQLAFESRDNHDRIWFGRYVESIRVIEDKLHGSRNRNISTTLRLCNTTMYLAKEEELSTTLKRNFRLVSGAWRSEVRVPRYLGNMVVVVARQPIRKMEVMRTSKAVPVRITRNGQSIDGKPWWRRLAPAIGGDR